MTTTLEAIRELQKTLATLEEYYATIEKDDPTHVKMGVTEILAAYNQINKQRQAVSIRVRAQMAAMEYAAALAEAGNPDEIWKFYPEDSAVQRIKMLREQFPSVGLVSAKYIVTGATETEAS